MNRPEPVSRRDRPAKPPLSRAAIIDAAMAVIDQEGAEKLTMRRLAHHLDTGPASLYVYVRNITELNALLIDRHLAGLDLRWDDPDESARQRVHRTLEDYAQLLASRPALAQAALITWPQGPHYLDLLELLLRALHDLGLDTPTAGRAVDLLLQVATASAAEQAAHASVNAQDLAELEATLGSADPERHPLLVEAGPSVFTGGSPAERNAWAVDVLINGLLRTHVAAAPLTDDTHDTDGTCSVGR
ncbi:TetR/AcrR family transcriptional regulator [Aeromicrobium endophyticum]|uniref:TetR/AcrR family transcriptional regulator n=1 Tax=Aeromicrobium endophyticum TaxID=2292704 RepID=UPI001313F186|nr:TetR/AcrR family transcriptional regulator [Aeromicrobium endophyticum]